MHSSKKARAVPVLVVVIGQVCVLENHHVLAEAPVNGLLLCLGADALYATGFHVHCHSRVMAQSRT